MKRGLDAAGIKIDGRGHPDEPERVEAAHRVPHRSVGNVYRADAGPHAVQSRRSVIPIDDLKRLNRIMRTKTLLAFASLALAALLAAPAMAQLAPPNGNRGVSMGHLHLTVKDVNAQKKFWTDFGGRPVKNGMLDLIEFPGVYVMLRQGDPMPPRWARS